MEITVTHLQMLAPATIRMPPPRAGLLVIHARKPTVSYYRFLYDAVGRDYNWTSRKKLSDKELADIIQDPKVEIHVLFADGVPAGFAEIDRRKADDIELLQFGLLPEFIGQGLGKYFLQWVIDKVWSYSPRRFWLHTCSKDHPAALPTYLNAGFSVFKTETLKTET